MLGLLSGTSSQTRNYLTRVLFGVILYFTVMNYYTDRPYIHTCISDLIVHQENDDKCILGVQIRVGLNIVYFQRKWIRQG